MNAWFFGFTKLRVFIPYHKSQNVFYYDIIFIRIYSNNYKNTIYHIYNSDTVQRKKQLNYYKFSKIILESTPHHHHVAQAEKKFY